MNFELGAYFHLYDRKRSNETLSHASLVSLDGQEASLLTYSDSKSKEALEYNYYEEYLK